MATSSDLDHPLYEEARNRRAHGMSGDLVQGVVEVAGGCHPTASHGAYDFDEEQIKLYLSMAGNVEGVGEYLEQYVTGATEEEYLEKASPRLSGLRYGEWQQSDA